MVDSKKTPKTYSLDPVVIAWVTQKAARITIEKLNGERANDSKVVNDILTAAMLADARELSHQRLILEKTQHPGKQIKAVQS